jgi:hypothetical protein
MNAAGPESLSGHKESRILNVLFWIFIGLTLFPRLWIYFNIELVKVDSDQIYMWLGATDFAKGLFYEPRYYAQNYNTFMEALFAVPLLWCGMKVYAAVPLATMFIALFPYYFSATYLFFKHRKIEALFVLAVIMCIPAQFDLNNSLPRGFVTGLFFCSFFVVSLVNPGNFRMIGFNTFMALLGYFANPTSAMVSLPFLFYIFLHHRLDPRWYFATLPSLLLFLPLHALFNGFYLDHPGYVMHPLLDNTSVEFFIQNIGHLDEKFGHINFFFLNSCITILLALLALMIVLFAKNRKAFYAMLVLLALLLHSFNYEKSLEGGDWAYMPHSRMYLGIPMFIALFGTVVKWPRAGKWLIVFAIPLLFASWKAATLRTALDRNFDERKYVGVHVLDIRKIFDATAFYKKFCVEENADLILVSNGFWLHNEITYGGPALDNDYPPTEEIRLEKRYWVRNANRDKVIPKIVLISQYYDLDARLTGKEGFKIKKLDSYGCFLIYDNKMKTRFLIRALRMAEYGGYHLQEE